MKDVKARWLFGVLALLYAAPPARSESIDLLDISRSGNDITITINAQEGWRYRLVRKVDITDEMWTSISGVNDLIAAQDGPAPLTDPGALSMEHAFYRVEFLDCDTGVPSNSTNALRYAGAMGLCERATETGTESGVISAQFTLASGSGTPSANSRAIRTSFGSNNIPLAGSSMVVLSTGNAAASGQVNPSFVSFQPGSNT
ncbi:MAG: hypothetical protein LC642_08380, partial [Verrucomicrobiaceae bacterium]|nr:hypothetical protein [Verrucomicrobiaceae bacterium]